LIGLSQLYTLNHPREKNRIKRNGNRVDDDDQRVQAATWRCVDGQPAPHFSRSCGCPRSENVFRCHEYQWYLIGVYYKSEQYLYNYGEAKRGSGVLPTSDHIYDLGPVTKTFVGTMLTEAVVEHKAKLTDDIRKYLPVPF
jgi:hypothetical protein